MCVCVCVCVRVYWLELVCVSMYCMSSVRKYRCSYKSTSCIVMF